MQEEYGTTAPDTARSTCPEWCVLDHSDYTECDRELGDLIHHRGDIDNGGAGFTIQIGGDNPEPFTIQRTQQTAPDGTVHEDGYHIGDHFMTCDEALELAKRTLQAIRSFTPASPKALDTLAMMSGVVGRPFDRESVRTEADATQEAMAIGEAMAGRS
jgi:hypothetical protein